MDIATPPTNVVERRSSLHIAEKSVAAAMMAVIVFLHIQYRIHAGALWRDELNSIALATMPTFRELWQNFQFDSLPLVWIGVLRLLHALGVETDAALRMVGLSVGLFPIAVLWLVAHLMKYGTPVLSLALVGLSPTVIRWGDSLRAYGLGLSLMLITFALIWKVVTSPGPKTFLLATVAAVCSVHTLYYNAVILFAVGIAGATVAARHRHWYRALLVLGIGSIAALSMVPYSHPIQNAKQWNNVFIVSHFNFSLFWEKLFAALSSANRGIGWLWVVLVVAAATAGIIVQFCSASSREGDRRDVGLYCAVVLLVGIPAFFGFLKILRYPTQPWYYVVLMGLMAVAVEGVLSVLPWHWWRNLGRMLLASGIAIWSFVPALGEMHVRQTNLDVIATKLQGLAVAGDIIVVAPWYFGITFERYYHGGAPWTTLPPIEDHKVHRYDLLKKRMATTNPIASVLDAMANALRSGHRVWIVGNVSYRHPEEPPPVLAPAPNDYVGWNETAYIATWSMQAAYFLQTHSPGVAVISVLGDQRINPYENAKLIVVQGRRDLDQGELQ
jgi:hypothetical protein